MKFAELQSKLIFELLPAYSKQVYECSSLKDLVAPTKTHLRAIANLVLDDFLLELKHRAPPQEMIE